MSPILLFILATIALSLATVLYKKIYVLSKYDKYNFIPALVFLVIIGFNKGMRGFVIWLSAMIAMVLVGWIMWRIITGSWNIKKWAKNGSKPETIEYKKRINSFWIYFAKLWIMAIAVLFLFTISFVYIMKWYVLHKGEF